MYLTILKSFLVPFAQVLEAFVGMIPTCANFTLVISPARNTLGLKQGWHPGLYLLRARIQAAGAVSIIYCIY